MKLYASIIVRSVHGQGWPLPIMNEPVEVTILMEDEVEAPTRLVGKKLSPFWKRKTALI